MSGSGALTKLGAGNLTIGGVNTFLRPDRGQRRHADRARIDDVEYRAGIGSDAVLAPEQSEGSAPLPARSSRRATRKAL